MKKQIQTPAGFQTADSSVNPEQFNQYELEIASREKDITDAYDQAILDLDTIINYANPTNAEVIWAVKRIATILKLLNKYAKNDLMK